MPEIASSVAGNAAAAVLTLLATIFSPLLALAAAGGIVAGAIDRNRARKATAPIVAAAAIGAVIAVAALAALAVANAASADPLSNIDTVTRSLPGLVRLR